MAILYGWSLDSVLIVDHSYVTSSDGYIWPCWGRSSSGELICSGAGSSLQADCISQPDSQAGIIYGITGVCHQTANRILWPARLIVSKADKYWVTVFLYGTYGTKNTSSLLEWEERKKRCTQIVDDKVEHTPLRGDIMPDDKEKQYLESINSLHQKALESPDLSRKEGEAGIPEMELSLTLDYRLGPGRNVLRRRSLYRLQLEVLAEKGKLDEAFLQGILPADQYAELVNRLIRKMVGNCQDVLGSVDLRRLFGPIRRGSLEVIDPDIMRHLSPP